MPTRIHPLSSRILSRLIDAEAKEPDPWLRDDLRIARLTVAHAARGDASCTCCSPHGLASYEVLGLRPEKVWPAIVARRKAQLGEFYSKFYDEHDLLRKDDGSLLGRFWSVPPVPKKPAQSVKLWCEKTNAARATNSRGGITLLRDNTISVPMAAPSIAAAYRNPDDSGSAKERPFFTVTDLQKFFEPCPGHPVKYRCLRTIQGMFLALEKRLGKKLQGGNFEFCLAVEDYRDGADYRSPTTVRVNLRLAEKLGYIEAVYGTDEMGHPRRDHFWHRPRTKQDKGLYRRVATYRLNPHLLLKWRELHRSHKAEVTPIRRPAKPADPEQPLPPAPAVPQQPKREQPAASAPMKQEHRSAQRNVSPSPLRKLTPREGPKLVNEMRRLMRGCGSVIEQHSGLEISLRADDPRYRVPLSQEDALVAACANLGIPYESAREHLKLIRPPGQGREKGDEA
jgi:hypothetical protein